ncbi:Yip1 family protein [Imperialibacter roseus]|uniref:Yip1 family protein n=1 Tax=Imperialibacter roseus TaxID=1324217 RepID=A0ABZ0IVF4_9BACT|nr:Yip1 family protein [Imperialibacter roseus]WOK09030.1 Yip1 family protein [Imperialibacter roseus]
MEETEESEITDNEIFTAIWTSPRQVFKYINDNHYEKYMTLLLVLGGIASAFDRASSRNMGDTLSIEVIIGIGVVAGGLFGWISYYIYASLLSWTGGWLNGKGSSKSILRMLSYALIPIVISVAFIVPQIAVYGVDIFKSDGDVTSAGLLGNIVFYVSALAKVILSIWTLILTVIGISEVQKLSIGKAILNLILPAVIIIVPILIIVLIVT